MVLCTVMLTWGVLCGNIASPKFNSLTFFTPGLQFVVYKVLVWKTRQKKLFPIILYKKIIVEISYNGYMSWFTLDLRVWTFSAVCHLILLLTPYGRHDMKSAVMFFLPVFCNFESQPIALWQCQISTFISSKSSWKFFFFSNRICCIFFSDKFVFRKGHFFKLQTTGIKNEIFGTKNLSLTLDLYKWDISHNVIDELSTYRTNFKISVVSDNSRISVGLCMIFECHFSLRFIQRRSGASTRRYRSTCRRRRC